MAKMPLVSTECDAIKEACMAAKIIDFPLERWQPAKPRGLRWSVAYRPIRRGSGIQCQTEGCKRKARRELLKTGECFCDEHGQFWEECEPKVRDEFDALIAQLAGSPT